MPSSKRQHSMEEAAAALAKAMGGLKSRLTQSTRSPKQSPSEQSNANADWIVRWFTAHVMAELNRRLNVMSEKDFGDAIFGKWSLLNPTLVFKAFAIYAARWPDESVEIYEHFFRRALEFGLIRMPTKLPRKRGRVRAALTAPAIQRLPGRPREWGAEERGCLLGVVREWKAVKAITDREALEIIRRGMVEKTGKPFHSIKVLQNQLALARRESRKTAK